jgi:polar amino acid transport system substrate-binding protein
MKKALISVGALLSVTALIAGCSTGSSSSSDSAASDSGTSSSKLAEVLDRGVLVVGTGSTNAPWHFKDDSGNLVGFDVDVSKMIAKALFDDETKIEFVEQTSDSRIPNLQTNKVDITCQFMTVTGARAQQVNFTIPYYREGVGLLLKEGGTYGDYNALKAAGSNATISILQNTYAEELVRKALPEAKVDQYDDVALIYEALNSGRADAAATDQSSVNWYVTQNPGYKDAGYGWSPQSYSCAVKQGDQDWLNFVNTALHEAMTGVEFDTYQGSFKTWFGVELPTPEIGFPVEFK